MENKTFYNEVLTDHNLHPGHKHALDDANMILEGVNPSCGDDIFLNLKFEDGVIKDGSFQGDGCAISQASADMMLDLIVGKTKEEALNKMLEYIQDVSIHGKTEKVKENNATIVSICEAYETKRVRNKEIKPNTYNRHMQTIKAIGNYKFANIPIQNVTANQIKQYLESERTKSNSSISLLSTYDDTALM